MRFIKSKLTTALLLSMISQHKLNAGGCQSIHAVNNLESSDAIWHLESGSCSRRGGDYSLITLSQHHVAGASLYQMSTLKFDKWPYPFDYSYKNQNELSYFIK